MYGGDVQPVLRCGQCNKPFDKQSTLKRHGYYCRSRRIGRATRTRSFKGIECHYPASTPKATKQRIEHIDDRPAELGNATPSLVTDSNSPESHQEGSNDSDLFLDPALVTSAPEAANFERGYIDWDDQNINFPEFLNSPTNDAVQYLSSGPLSSSHHSIPYQTLEVQQTIPTNLSIPGLPTYTVRSLIQRPKMKTGAQMITNVILHTLKSYSLMMLRNNTLPPYIHMHTIASEVENSDMEPLTNCISLMHMISSGVQGSRKLFWKNVRMECERFCEELNKWEMLAAMQALSIYIIVRLDEGETDHNNFDYLLIAAVKVIAKQLNCSDITSMYSRKISSWKDWIFEESKRRLCVIYGVVNMLVYFEPATMCNLQADIIIAPLPVKKQLWEAADEFVWKAESQRDPRVQTALGLAANGELVHLDIDQQHHREAALFHTTKPLNALTPSRSVENWEEWCSGMDELGVLVMLAASLIE
ncbi:hypothetical protein FQN52_008324 [Onygenales sp. PD_12]|nr:hypothetical protein FQN52_008324 [Onygenales sp. PD_12]